MTKADYWPYFKQALMTGITGVVSLVMAQKLQLPQGYWAVMSAIIVIQSDIDATIKMASNRLAGTAIGALMGGLILSIFGHQSMVIFGFGIFLVVFISMILKMESYRIAAVALAIVLLTSQSGQPWVVAWHRFLEVSLGIIVALVMTTVIYPVRVYRILVDLIKRK